MQRPSLVALTLSCLLLVACASTPPAKPMASTQASALHFERIVVSAQPSADDLRQWRESGVSSVLNLRTTEEMADRSRVPFDESALAAELGIDYRAHPIDGKALPFSADAVDALAAALAAGEGKVLVHCASGVRAGWVYAAYAVKYQGMPPEEALRSLAPLGHWPLPLEQMTGLPLRLELKRENEDGG
ncbi:beta-lactamase hydrolase domain-containing protein [Aquimonas voraii]|uniref:TIGR01244 family protein n=1 Tax=Aquimonas voraii TaxID=265719 RepID=A0A1G6U233_9GAMM|nr:sulfur transferase domain-containing protein [Aquimonas voraii]SDD35398.1 TIGR01244 family protein [Aquimonas voraii]